MSAGAGEIEYLYRTVTRMQTREDIGALRCAKGVSGTADISFVQRHGRLWLVREEELKGASVDVGFERGERRPGAENSLKNRDWDHYYSYRVPLNIVRDHDRLTLSPPTPRRKNPMRPDEELPPHAFIIPRDYPMKYAEYHDAVRDLPWEYAGVLLQAGAEPVLPEADVDKDTQVARCMLKDLMAKTTSGDEATRAYDALLVLSTSSSFQVAVTLMSERERNAVQAAIDLSLEDPHTTVDDIDRAHDLLDQMVSV
jgi:hypothetical protein